MGSLHVSEHAAAFSLVSKVDVEVTSSFDRVGRATRHQQGCCDAIADVPSFS
jgi:hypothetical protein